MGQDDRRGIGELDGRGVRRVQLPVVVAAAAEPLEVFVGQVRDHLLEPVIRAEEVLADVRARFDRVLLELAVEGGVHLVDQDAVGVTGQEFVPFATPDDLDDVPSGAAEDRLELLDDLAVAANRPIQPLQVAVHDEDEVVQAFARGER